MTKLMKSPLRYPGGKSRALKHILPHIPATIKEFREPFLGGGSVYLAVRSIFKERLTYWINDLNADLYSFWKESRDSLSYLVAEVEQILKNAHDGRQLFDELRDSDESLDSLSRAVRFFVMNRITFSGVVGDGGYSQQAFEKRFTQSSIDRLQQLAGWLDNTTITNQDYESVVLAPGDNVFLYLDPPYLSATRSRLYGDLGRLHTGFDHEHFASVVKNCKHRYLISYDDSSTIRELFNFASIIEFQLHYGMTNANQTQSSKGNEILIKNY